MISNDQELQAMIERVNRFQQQIAHLRRVETNPSNYRLSAGGYLAELDRMNMEIREYLALHPTLHTNNITGEDGKQDRAGAGRKSTPSLNAAYAEFQPQQQTADLTTYQEFLRRRKQPDTQQQQDALTMATSGSGGR